MANTLGKMFPTKDNASEEPKVHYLVFFKYMSDADWTMHKIMLEAEWSDMTPEQYLKNRRLSNWDGVIHRFELEGKRSDMTIDQFLPGTNNDSYAEG